MTNHLIELQQEALNSLPEPLLIVAEDGLVQFFNRSFKSLMGELRVGDLAASFWPNWPDPADWQYRELASEFVRSGGDKIPVKVVTYPGTALLVRVIASLDNLHDQRFTHQQRLETLGMLAGGVAHDFNNVLTGILGHVTYLKTVLPASGSHVESLTAVEDGVAKASQISAQILNFSRLESADRFSKLNLGQVITRTCQLIKGAVPSACELRWRIPDKLFEVIGSEARLAQIIINLVINARDAIAERGSISVELNGVTDRSELERAFSAAELPSQSYACLSVTDTGQGISEDVIARIFEPYFSTKAERGTGLGLTTVKSIVAESGGAIDLQSKPGKGTCFKVYLPLVEQHVGDQVSEQDFIHFGNGEKILVVDDEHTVRNVLRLSLEHLGYKVTTAVSGTEAWRIFESAPEAFDLVILDMILPGLAGDQVFDLMKSVNPSVRVLLVSGFSSERSVQHALAQGALDYVAKPFTMELLAEKVKGCLSD